MTIAAKIFGTGRALVGMVHLGALPGTPRYGAEINELIERAVRESTQLADAGFDALILENMHDVPYLRREVGPEIIASMTAIAREVRTAVDVPLGVQILAGANRAALAVAQAARLDFIRAEGFVYASVADEGVMSQADAGPLLRYRRAIGAEGIYILADIKKKHSSHAITADVSLAETARTAEFFGADGVIITGVATARPTSLDDLREARAATQLPLAVGSGARPESLREFYEYADAVIIGSWYKEAGSWDSAPDPKRVEALIASARRARL